MGQFISLLAEYWYLVLIGVIGINLIKSSYDDEAMLIDPQQIVLALNDGAVLIDVRPDKDYKEKRIKKSKMCIMIIYPLF